MFSHDDCSWILGAEQVFIWVSRYNKIYLGLSWFGLLFLGLISVFAVAFNIMERLVKFGVGGR